MSMRTFATLMSLTALLVVAPVFAEGPLKSTIPFNFTVGHTHMNAGTYVVRYDVPGVLRISSSDGKASCGVITLAVQGKSTPTAGRLVFNKYGNHYFLSQVWTPGYVQGRELLKDKAEKEEIAANLSTRQQAVVYASSEFNRRSSR